MIPRDRVLGEVLSGLRGSAVTALLGPRQCGKTTLARAVVQRHGGTFFDLEDPRSLARLDAPMLALEPLRGIVVIDEVQRRPDLLPLLRVLADRPRTPARFLLIGSASPDLMRGASESLAGRIRFVDMAGFGLDEVGAAHLRRLWLRGGFPRAYLARTNAASLAWRVDFIRTFLERDLRGLGINLDPEYARRFWTMLAHSHGQVWSGVQIGGSLGVTYHTARRHLDLFCGAFVIRQLQPWFANLGKRVVKAPKVYVRDSGMLHALLDLRDEQQLTGHPKLGASWEGFVIEQILAGRGDREAYFWATHGGAELDLLLLRGGKRWGVEVKYADAPTLTRSMRIAIDDLSLEHLWVVYPGETRYALAPRATALPASHLPDLIEETSLARKRRRANPARGDSRRA